MAGLGHRIGRTLRIPGRGSRRLVIVLLVLAVAAATGTVAALGAPALLDRLGLTTSGALADPPASRPRPVLEALPAHAPAPTAAGIAAKLDPLAGSGGLGRLTGTVLDPAANAGLWSRSPAKAQVPGSTVKLLTAAAALLSLEPTHQLTTRVLAGPTPDSIVLVGGGDPTLSALPAGRSSVYQDAPKLDDLAAAVQAAHPGPVRKVIIDVSRYRGEGLAPGWLPADVAGGFVAPIAPLMLDGGRVDPTEQDGARVSTPAETAGSALAGKLGAEAPVTVGSAAPDAAVLGEVRSAPVVQLVEQALRHSDNVLAEVLAHEVAIAQHAEPSYAGAAKAVLDTLAQAGFDVEATRLSDGSGLSTSDQVTAALLGQVLAKAASPAGADPTTTRLRALISALPVAGGDGTLDDRFGTGSAAAGRGFVRAKTGTLTDVSSLAGIAVTEDGKLLVFALMSTGTSPAIARPQLDAIAATLRSCGCR